MKLAGCLFLLAIALSAQTGAVVEGAVTDSFTHTPVAGVKVNLAPPLEQKGESYTATTDASGGFRMVGVPLGEYIAIYERDGFWPQIKLGIRTGIGVTTRADAEVDRLGIIHGRVLDPDGKPVPKASVHLGSFDDDEPTDTEGRFEIKDLPPGAYRLRASLKTPEPPAKQEQTAERTAIVPTYFPSTINPAEAELIQVRPGSDLAGYDIHLRTARVYRLRGVVLDEAGKPIPDAEVSLLSPGEGRILAGRVVFRSTQYFMNFGGEKNTEGMTNSAKDGSFGFASVPAGDWSLRAERQQVEVDEPRHDHSGPRFVASDLVKTPVSERDIDNIEVRFARQFEVEITADWGGGQQPPAPNRMPPVMLLPEGGGFARAPDGLKFNLAPGHYRVLPLPAWAPGFYPAAAMVAGRNVMGQDFELTAGTPGLQVVYKRNPGTVRGTVEDGEGAIVLLWPLGSASPSFVPTVRAGAHGAFEFSNVPPGDYSAIAFDRVPQEGAPAVFASMIVAGGTRVSMHEGSVEAVEIAVMRWAQ